MAVDKIFREFRLGDIFEKLPVKKVQKAELMKKPSDEYRVPVVYAKFGDNGIMYWGREDAFTTYANVISIVYNGVISAGKAYAQERPTGILAESYFIRLKGNPNIPFEATFYIARVIEHVIYPKYSRENLATWDRKVEDEVIKLPIVDNTDATIDFAYMRNCIRTLEKDTIAVLGKYIRDHAMTESVLTESERAALADFTDIKKSFKKYKLGDLFAASTGDVDLQQKDINGRGIYFINSGVENNGIKGKTDKPAKTFPPNTITIDFWGNAYYRDFEYKLATHNHVFSLEGKIIKNKYVGLYLVGAMAKLPLMFSYDHMATWNKLHDVEILLPVVDDGSSLTVDTDFMESYMRAIEKQSFARAKNFVFSF